MNPRDLKPCASCGGPATRQSRSGLCRKCWLRAVPDDFAERAATMRRFELQRHYGASDGIMDRWYREAGLSSLPPLVPVPDDFADLAPTMGLTQLSRHYGRVSRVIQRWLDETGLRPLKNPPRAAREHKAFTPHRHGQPFIWKGQRIPPVPGRDTSLAGLAAEHLRRFTPVYRCQAKGAADPKGEYYRYGNTVLTPDELLIRAKRNGWEVCA